MSIMNKKIFAFFGVFFFLLFVYNALTFQRIGIRGSDHYWYVSATQSLISGEGVKTNHFYPVQALKYRYEERKGFVHNLPQVYLAAVPGFLVGSFNGWVILNTFSYVISLLLYYHVLKKLIPNYLAVFGLSLVLIFPVSLWLVPQPLSEPFLSLLISGVLFTYFVFPARLIHFKYITISLLIILLVLSRRNFLLLFPLIPFAYFLEMGKNKRSLIGSLMFLILPFLFYSFFSKYFPGISEGSLKAMLLHYSEDNILLLRKETLFPVGRQGQLQVNPACKLYAC